MTSFLSRTSLVKVEAQRADVLSELPGRLLERHHDAGLAVLERAADQELDRQHRLAAARPAAHERRPPARQAAVGDLVQPLDAGGRLVDPHLRYGSPHLTWHVTHPLPSRHATCHSVQPGLAVVGRPAGDPRSVARLPVYR